jgi:hypothetical protein
VTPELAPLNLGGLTGAELAALLAGLLAGWAAAELPKAQGVRLLDVALLGPLMAYVATQPDAATALPRLALLGAAGATVSYNGRNYLRARA